MTIFKRSAALASLLVFAAACGGGDAPQTETTPATTTENAAPSGQPGAVTPAEGGSVHEVRMVTTQNGASGVFEPATITVRQGDVIRFTNDGGTAHNANFNVPDNAGKAGLPSPTPYLVTGTDVAEVQINMEPGTYQYQCDPHAATGMIGTVVVQ